MANKVEAVLDSDGSYASINTNCLYNFKIEPKLLLGWVHSKVFNFIYEVFFDGLRMAGGYLPYSAPYLSCMYVPKFNKSSQNAIIDLVDKILAAKKADSSADTTSNEHKIDLLVYHLYGLSFDEAKIIDSELTEAEFYAEEED